MQQTMMIKKRATALTEIKDMEDYYKRILTLNDSVFATDKDRITALMTQKKIRARN